MPPWQISLETANRLYSFSWGGLIVAGLATFVCLYLQYWTSGVRDGYADTAMAKLAHETALAQVTTAKLELENTELKLQLAERTRPLVERRLSADQSRILHDKLLGSGLALNVSVIGGDQEITNYSNDLIAALEAAGVRIGGGTRIGGAFIPGSPMPDGVSIVGAPSAAREQLHQAFAAASIPHQVRDSAPFFGTGGLQVVIGSRPNLSR